MTDDSQYNEQHSGKSNNGGSHDEPEAPTQAHPVEMVQDVTEQPFSKTTKPEDSLSTTLAMLKVSHLNSSMNSSLPLERPKRQVPTPYILPVIADLYTAARISGYCNLLATLGPAFVLNQITNDANAACTAACCPVGLPAVPGLYNCNLDAACIFALPDVNYATPADCAARTIVDLQVLYNQYCPPAAVITTTTTTTSTTPFDPYLIILLAAGVPIATASVVSAGALAVTPDLPIITSQGIPPGNDPVGCPWGGGLPQGRSVITRLALSLVPGGKTPVAVFPPFHSPRTRKAVCVIFAEDSNNENHSYSSGYIRFKRSMSRSHLRRKQRRPSFLSRQLRQLNYKLKEASESLMTVLKCTRATIQRIFSGGKQRIRQQRTSRRDKYDDEVNSFDDCFDDLEEPRYGFVCRVRLVENQPCVLGSTCRGVPDEDNDLIDIFDQAFDILTTMDYAGRQTGEGFSSAGPADCRVRSTGAC